MSKNITLVSKDGEHEVELPEHAKAEITNLRAQGWATKAERQETARAEKKLADAQEKQQVDAVDVPGANQEGGK